MNNQPNHYPASAQAQHQQHQPGHQEAMHPEPEIIKSKYQGSNKLKAKVTLISAGDNGIKRSIVVL